jgi:hypothetical protein
MSIDDLRDIVLKGGRRVRYLSSLFEIESAEKTAIIINAAWVVSLVANGGYLFSNPITRFLYVNLPPTFLLAACTLLLSLHVIACVLGGTPSGLIHNEAEQDRWYRFRFALLVASALLFAFIALLMVQVAITWSLIIHVWASCWCALGTRRVYILMRRDQEYRRLLEIKQQACQLGAHGGKPVALEKA